MLYKNLIAFLLFRSTFVCGLFFFLSFFSQFHGALYSFFLSFFCCCRCFCTLPYFILFICFVSFDRSLWELSWARLDGVDVEAIAIVDGMVGWTRRRTRNTRHFPLLFFFSLSTVCARGYAYMAEVTAKQRKQIWDFIIFSAGGARERERVSPLHIFLTFFHFTFH